MKQHLITLLVGSSLCAVFPALASVVVPIPSVVVQGHRECGKWWVAITYTATSVDDSVLDQLANYRAYGAFEQTKYFTWGDKSQFSTPTWNHLGSLRDKLDKINKDIFGVPDPAPGQQATRDKNGAGSCPYDAGHIPCVGTMVSDRASYDNYVGKGELPTTFPAGACAYIPRQSGSCKFDVAASTIDYGVISPGIHNRAVDVPFHCSEPTTFEIHLLNPSGGTTDTVESEHMKSVLRINDQPLPYTSRIDGSSTLSVSALSTIDEQASGHVTNAATLRISIE